MTPKFMPHYLPQAGCWWGPDSKNNAAMAAEWLLAVHDVPVSFVRNHQEARLFSAVLGRDFCPTDNTQDAFESLAMEFQAALRSRIAKRLAPAPAVTPRADYAHSAMAKFKSRTLSLVEIAMLFHHVANHNMEAINDL